MKVIYQNYEYECGVCVLTMIHNFLYKRKLNKQLVSDEVLYSKNGMSIEDFESNSITLGFNSKSYKIPFNEFINLKLNDFFVTCILTNSMYHYVICKISNNCVWIFDSSKGKYKITISEFEKIFSEIVITFKKSKEYNNVFDKTNINNTKLFFDNDYRFCLVFVLLESIMFFTTIIASVFIKVFINDIFPTANTYSLIFTVLFFLILYIFNFLFEMLIKYFKYQKFKNIFKYNFYIYQRIMIQKSKNFFNKIDRKIVLQFLNFINIEIEKKYFLIPASFFDIFSIIVLFILISFISPYFIFVIIISIIISIIIMLIKKHANEKYYNDLELSSNEITNDLNNFYTFLENERNNYKTKSLISGLQNGIKNNFNLNDKKMFVDSICSSSSIFLDKFIFLLFALVSSLVVFELKISIHISSILLSFTLLNMLNDSIGNIMELFSKIPIYKKSKIYISDLENLHNLKVHKGVLILESLDNIVLKNITFHYQNSDKLIFDGLNIKLFNDTFIFGKNGIGKSTLFRILSLDYEIKFGNIYFDEIDMKNLSTEKLLKNIILQTSDSIKSDIDFSSIMAIDNNIKNSIISLIKKMNINLGNLNKENLSKGEVQIINFLSLLEEKNKLILLDESLSNVDDEMISFLFKNFKDYIWSNNFILFISHNMKLKKYFNKEVKI